MPELPEVETVRIGLNELLPGHKVVFAASDWAKSFPNSQADVNAFLIGSKVVRVRRRAKVLIIDLDTNYSLIVHLKMTGQLVYRALGNRIRFGAGHPNSSLIGQLPDKSTRVTLELDKAHLFFNDQRKFGWMKLLPTVEIEQLDFFKKVGPEPLEKDFTSTKFIQCLRKRNNSGAKAVLLDQTIVAGVGNIYADESLWGAGIHPAKLVREINDRQLRTLFSELQFVLKLAIDKGGSTDKNYVNAEGKLGSYLNFARVFRREELDCPRCSSAIQKLKVAGRGTHICPACQKL